MSTAASAACGRGASWGADGKTPTFEFCICCGVQFGYLDAIPEAARTYRNEWFDRGSPWFIAAERPSGWNLFKQLRQIPEPFKD